MITKIFSVYDSKLNVFSTPFPCPTLGGAERAFSDAVNDPKTEIGKHPEDYSLYCIAEFDDENGQYSNVDHISLGLASRFVRES